MNIHQIKYVTLNDSRVVASGVIKLGEVSVNLSDFDFSTFAGEQRKVIFGWAEGYESLKYGPAYKSTSISSRKIKISLVKGAEGVTIDLDGKELQLSTESLPEGDYFLEVTVDLDLPLETFGEVPDHIKPLLQYSQIVNVTARLTDSGDRKKSLPVNSGPVYDGADRLGFFLADLEKMDEYIKSNCPADVVDLQKAFCETEIANELFAAGLLVLVWGMTPWHYYIYGLSDPADMRLVPSAMDPQLQGGYRIRNDIRELSVVPGEQLLNWPLCLQAKWPKINLGGEGEAVEINVHLRGFDPIHGELGPPLAVITAHRNNVDPIIEPLLVVDIESCMVEAGY
jgi:hypothetical protein